MNIGSRAISIAFFPVAQVHFGTTVGEPEDRRALLACPGPFISVA